MVLERRVHLLPCQVCVRLYTCAPDAGAGNAVINTLCSFYSSVKYYDGVNIRSTILLSRIYDFDYPNRIRIKCLALCILTSLKLLELIFIFQFRIE